MLCSFRCVVLFVLLHGYCAVVMFSLCVCVCFICYVDCSVCMCCCVFASVPCMRMFIISVIFSVGFSLCYVVQYDVYWFMHGYYYAQYWFYVRDSFSLIILCSCLFAIC